MDAINDTLAEALLVFTRALLHATVEGGAAPATSLPETAVGGLFVTLYDEAGEVRGSRGTTAPPSMPLAELAAEVAKGAAFDDPRFPPIEAAELQRCRIAVSVLGPPERIRSPEPIGPGVTALKVTGGLFSGTTLPEVGWGRGWDAATYLAFACRKAGLHALAWEREETEVLAYRSSRAAEPF